MTSQKNLSPHYRQNFKTTQTHLSIVYTIQTLNDTKNLLRFSRIFYTKIATKYKQGLVQQAVDNFRSSGELIPLLCQ